MGWSVLHIELLAPVAVCYTLYSCFLFAPACKSFFFFFFVFGSTIFVLARWLRHNTSIYVAASCVRVRNLVRGTNACWLPSPFFSSRHLRNLNLTMIPKGTPCLYSVTQVVAIRRLFIGACLICAKVPPPPPLFTC